MNNIDKLKHQYNQHYRKFNEECVDLLPHCAEEYYDAQLYLLNDKIKMSNVLDIGTGNGYIIAYFLKNNANSIDSVEIDENLYNEAKEKFLSFDKVKIYNSNILNFFDRNIKKYDIIICYDVIEHLEKEGGIDLIYKIYDSLNNKGIAILRTDNMANIIVGNYSRYMDITHLSGYTEQSLTHVMEFCGFHNITVVEPKFPLFSKLWRWHWINKKIQSALIRIQDRKIPQCLHKDLVVFGEKQ